MASFCIYSDHGTGFTYDDTSARYGSTRTARFRCTQSDYLIFINL